MSNIEVIQGLYDAFGRGDIESVLQALRPEIEYVEPEIEGLLYGGTRRGVEAVADEALAVIPQTWERVELRPEEWIDGGDMVVVLGQFSARGKGPGGQLGFAHVLKMRDGKGCMSSPSSTPSRSTGRSPALVSHLGPRSDLRAPGARDLPTPGRTPHHRGCSLSPCERERTRGAATASR